MYAESVDCSHSTLEFSTGNTKPYHIDYRAIVSTVKLHFMIPRARIPLRIIFVFSFRHRINNIQQSECHLAIYSFGHKEYVVLFFLSIQLNEKWCNWMRRIERPIPNEIVTIYIRMHKLFWARKECEFDVKFAKAANITIRLFGIEKCFSWHFNRLDNHESITKRNRSIRICWMKR